MAGVAIALTLDENGRCSTLRGALCGVGDTPVDVSGALAPLRGHAAEDDAIKDAAAAVRAAIEPGGNVHASVEYQRHLAGVLIERGLRTALERARHG
jgi:carbon-monoxide dehydrogenase medium subunit